MVKPREKRVPIMMSEDEMSAIDDWRFANRVATRSDAIRRLCRIALIGEDLKPELNNKMKTLLDSVLLLGDETLQERPRTREENEELRSLTIEVLSHVSAVYEKTVEQAVRTSDLIDGASELQQALDWEARAKDLLHGKSLFKTLREDPEAMAALEEAVKNKRKKTD
jgi:hypothetical protein